ncbi:MAG: YdcF family protein [Rhodoferax sp.]|uniref:YdcF family protein n=1 Tax=Rhodoferax sp. TaxID=50421 RepID=UPI001400B047|nr:YdcF family protein [Rhodoferax sp.]NDP38846.1 YdcF family protein [Rhodoferax sp.]
MIYLHRLLPLALSPIALILLLMAWAAFRRSRVAALLAIVLLYAASVPALSDPLFRAVEQQQLRLMPESVAPAQAVVVLSGMMLHVPGKQAVVPEWGEAVDRFFGGVELYAAGKAPRLVFTGGLLPWQGDQEPEGQVLRRMALRLGVPADAMVVSGPAQNTEQESTAVRRLLEPAVQRIVLVTSAFHMSRAKSLFEQAGFVVTPYPVDFRVEVRGTTPMDYLPDARAFWRTDLAVRELLGRAYYALRAIF